ncbi:MAG TPA: ABC transporter permease, partial [Sphaerochaeta sp.]|nr:ABC transporter permease [Sphaerochaeta sp.]
PGSWFKGIFKFITPNNTSIPTGAIVLFLTAFIAYVILTKTKMGRYIFAIGSNKNAARLSGVDVQKWEMMAYVIAGFTAGMGGIAFAAVYTTVMPAQGAGFELYAIAGAVIGGTSLSGGAGSVFGTMIGVYIMSVLRSGLPSMNLQSQYQTFFTGVVVIGAVLLDIYRTKKATEVKMLTPADQFREEKLGEIEKLKQDLANESDPKKRGILQDVIKKVKNEMNSTYKTMKKEEKAEQASLALQEKEFAKTIKDKQS